MGGTAVAPRAREGQDPPAWTDAVPQAPVCPLEQGACRVMLLLRVVDSDGAAGPGVPP